MVLVKGAILGPAALCRLDATTIASIEQRRRLRPIVVGSALCIAIGAGAYGATMGLWRGPTQAIFAALKLVALLCTLWGLTTLTNLVFAGLLRARLGAAQVATCTLLGLAVTAIVLGALAPVSLFFTLHAPPLATEGASELAASFRVAQSLLGVHVVVFAIAGTLGVVRMWGLLRALVDRVDVARRVLWAWLLVEGLVGMELSWVLRPFVGKPNLPITLVREDAFASSFFDEIDRIATALLGAPGTLTALGLAVIVLVLVAAVLQQDPSARFRVQPAALVLVPDGGRRSIVVPWAAVRSVRRVGSAVEVTCLDVETLEHETINLPCDDVAAARAAYEQIEQARAGPGAPFRSAPIG